MVINQVGLMYENLAHVIRMIIILLWITIVKMINIILSIIKVSFSTDVCQNPNLNYDFNFCKYQAENDFTRCLTKCSSDPLCSSTCSREYDNAFKNCPCQENCPEGCPCPVYKCDETNSVLVLSTRRFYNRQIVIDVNGREDYDFELEFGDGTEAWESCSIVWQGEMFLYGGWKNRNQISKLSNCKVERLGDLPFRHRRGGCAVTETGQVYLCFHYHSDKLCYQADEPLGEFASIGNSTYGHRATRMAIGNDEVVVVGGADPNHPFTEVMNINENEWKQVHDYAFHEDIYNSPVVFFDDTFFVFGGKCGSESVSTIAGLKSIDYTWRSYGDLVQARRGHGAIYSSGHFLVVGGFGFDETFITEKCILDNGEITCTKQYPDLFGYWYTPELALVPHDFCKTDEIASFVP